MLQYSDGIKTCLGGFPEKIGSTAEGVNTTSVLVQRGENKNIYLPISAQVLKLSNNEITPQAAVADLMLRDTKSE